MGIESKIHDKLLNHPKLKKVVKRCYQRTMVSLSKKFKSEGNIVRVSPNDDYDYFFGYYDKSPWDITGRYMLCMKASDTSKNVAPKEKLEILLIDTENNNETKKIAESHSWNVQQGCMAQWLGPKFDRKIIYNDFRDNKYCSIILDVFSGEEKVIDMPVYSVSSDGKFALTLDFSRLHRLRPGYGYSNLEDQTKSEKLPDSPCVWLINLSKNTYEPYLYYKDFYNFETRDEMINAEHKVNHIMISPNNDKFMIIHRWFIGNKKYSRLITCEIKTKSMYNLSDDDMVSHCYWKNNDEIIAFENKKGEGNGYYLMKDKSKEFTHLWPSLKSDGHPSYSPDGNYVVTDSYPNKKRVQTLRLLNDDMSISIAKVFSPFKYDNDTRCDLHPRWSRDGKSICFDGCFEDNRRLYVIKDVYKSIAHKVLNENTQLNSEEKGLVSCVIPTYKRCDTIQRAVDSVLNQTYKHIEVLVVNDNDVNDEFSLELVKVMSKYKNNDKVRLINQPEHINGAVARNYGVKESKGEFIAFLDDDDEWLPTKLEKQIKLFEDDSVGVVTCLWGSYKENKLLKKCPIYNEKKMEFKILSRTVSIFTSTVVIRRKEVVKFGGFDETLLRHQDLQFLTDASAITKFKVLPEYLIKLHTDSDINRPKLAKFLNSKRMFLNCERDKINKFGFISKRRIYGAHNFEIIFAALKEKNVKILVKYGLKVCINIFAIYDVIVRYLKRKFSKVSNEV